VSGECLAQRDFSSRSWRFEPAAEPKTGIGFRNQVSQEANVVVFNGGLLEMDLDFEASLALRILQVNTLSLVFAQTAGCEWNLKRGSAVDAKNRLIPQISRFTGGNYWLCT
jgi:hypothetical protein